MYMMHREMWQTLPSSMRRGWRTAFPMEQRASEAAPGSPSSKVKGQACLLLPAG